MDLADSEGRPLTAATTTTNDFGRYAWATVAPSAPVVFVRATYRLDGNPVFLERAIAAPRVPGDILADLTPSTTLALKGLRALAPSRGLVLDRMPTAPYEALCSALAASIDPATVADVVAMTDADAAKRLMRLAPGALEACFSAR
jgi:hypothetical protein